MFEDILSGSGEHVPKSGEVIFAPAPASPERAASVLSVDLKLLQDNWRKLALEVAPGACGATVKGDAYGLGLEPCVRALHGAGCRKFFVALPGEGAVLRTILDDSDIFVLDGLFPGEADFYRAHDLVPVLNDLAEIDEWAALSRRRNEKLPAAVHIDTGINRLGLSPRDVERLAGDTGGLADIDVKLVMSHLACADRPGHEMNARQRHAFNRLRALLPAAPASLANSAGCFLGAAFAYDLARPGVALYGGNPFAERSNPMSPVVHLYGRILQVRELTSGEHVGYGATWRAERPSRIATIATGYRDGYPRAITRRAGEDLPQVMIGGQFAPIVGRVSMDLICVDVSDISTAFARRGGYAELLGNNITVDDLAGWAGTIPYEILTRLGSRHTRLYSPFDS